MVTVDPAMTHEEVQQVLPWYANKRLDADVSRRVAAHLETCPICRNDVDGLNATFAIHERSLPQRAVDERRLDDLFARIDRHEAQRRERPAATLRPNIWLQMKSWFAAHPGLVAGSLASALLAAVLVPQVLRQPDVVNEYSVLSSPQEVVSPFAVRVQFAEAVQSTDVERLVAALNIQLPMHRIEQRSATDFSVVFDSKPSVASAGELLRQLSSSPNVTGAAIDSDPRP